jgi:hypothetical protein
MFKRLALFRLATEYLRQESCQAAINATAWQVGLLLIFV